MSYYGEESNSRLLVPIAREVDAVMFHPALSAELAANDNAREAIREHREAGYTLRRTDRTEDELVLEFVKRGAR
jgi:hypothetical protein